MLDEISKSCERLSRDRILNNALFSRSQIYAWKETGRLDRKERSRKPIPETTVENAAALVAQFPHFSGRKGQDYMLYNRMGLIGEKAYDSIKKNVRQLFAEEVSCRNLFPDKGFYEHIRPEACGEIWAEDFTDLYVEGSKFQAALLLDVFDTYYLGFAVDRRSTARLVGVPLEKALAAAGGRGPSQFLLSDNGSVYISDEHQELLTSAQIVQRRIPSCVPQYNGTTEGGMRQFKSVFYNIWEKRTREMADEGKKLLERVEAAVEETIHLMNEVIPRPSLDGVTPADVHHGQGQEKRQEIKEYREEEESRRDVPPWNRGYWEILKSGVRMEAMSDGEVLTKLAFFHRRPLRRIAQRNRKSVGQLS